jgi:hypothetical protein
MKPIYLLTPLLSNRESARSLAGNDCASNHTEHRSWDRVRNDELLLLQGSGVSLSLTRSDVLISLLAGLASTLRTRASLQVEILAPATNSQFSSEPSEDGSPFGMRTGSYGLLSSGFGPNGAEPFCWSSPHL